jgi:hypothetical protein
VVNLSAEIGEDQSSELEEIIERNPGWNKTLVVRALLSYFIGLSPIEQENLVKKHSVKKRVKSRKPEIER